MRKPARANGMECWSNGVLGFEPITPPLQYSNPDEANKRNETYDFFLQPASSFKDERPG
jgi:hypothetical protein